MDCAEHLGGHEDCHGIHFMYRNAEQSHYVETMTMAKRPRRGHEEVCEFSGDIEFLHWISRQWRNGNCPTRSSEKCRDQRFTYALKGLYMIVASRVIVYLVLEIIICAHERGGLCVSVEYQSQLCIVNLGQTNLRLIEINHLTSLSDQTAPGVNFVQ